ncbi:MAG TPA: hypothetical protein VG102_02575 [Candidatus Paceibacterota bacterium]|nr:hypothetical protein [Candidatus Paceibacterota bacterium]
MVLPRDVVWSDPIDPAGLLEAFEADMDAVDAEQWRRGGEHWKVRLIELPKPKPPFPLLAFFGDYLPRFPGHFVIPGNSFLKGLTMPPKCCGPLRCGFFSGRSIATEEGVSVLFRFRITKPDDDYSIGNGTTELTLISA